MASLPPIPQWLSHFKITVCYSDEESLFDSWNNDINVLRFENTLGAQVGEYLRIGETRLKIIDIEIYSDGLSIVNKPKEKFGIHLNIVVEKN